MTTHTTHRISKAERDFDATVQYWRDLGLEVTTDEDDNRFFGHTKSASIRARAHSLHVFWTCTLQKPSNDPIRIRRRTTIRNRCMVFHGITGKSVDVSTANRYLRQICEPVAA